MPNEKAKTQAETEAKAVLNDNWDKPMTCPIDPAELAECEACQ